MYLVLFKYPIAKDVRGNKFGKFLESHVVTYFSIEEKFTDIENSLHAMLCPKIFRNIFPSSWVGSVIHT